MSQELEQKLTAGLNKRKERIAKRRIQFYLARKEKYHFAKSIGFTAEEATILMGWSVEKIRQLAQNRGWRDETP